MLQDGTTVSGWLLGYDTFNIRLLDGKEQLRSFVKSDLKSHGFIESPMPSYKNTLTPQEIADIVSYLSSLRTSAATVAPTAVRGRIMKLKLAILLILAAASLQAQVTFDRILSGDKEPHNWLSYSGTLKNQRYSPLTQITTANVKNLRQEWIWQARSLEKFEATPLVVDGVMYTVEQPNNVVALDAVTGRPYWQFNYTPAPEARACCGRLNRGVAILGDTLYMGTLDALSRRARREDRTAALEVQGRRGEGRLFDHAQPDHREGQGDHRHRRRRRADPRIHLCVQREDRRGGLALLHDSRTWRAGQRDLVW